MGKLLKRMTCVVAAFALALSIPVAAFADGEGYSITVKSGNSAVSIDGNTYEAYKVMNFTTNDVEDAFSYTLESAFANFEYNGSTGAELVDVVSENANSAKWMFNFENSLASFIQQNGISANAQATASEGVANIGLSETGYYLVSGRSEGANEPCGMVLVSDSDKNVEMVLKFDTPTLSKKIVTDEGSEVLGTAAELGTTVNFKLDSFVPNMSQYEDGYTFTVTDTFSKGLVPVATGNAPIDVAVSVDGSTYDYFTVEQVSEEGADAFSFKIVFDPAKFLSTLKEQAGKPITITYSATLTKDAIAEGNTNAEADNKAYLTYSNNPYSDGTADSPEQTVHVYALSFYVWKYTNGAPATCADMSASPSSLPGAKFVFFKKDDNGNILYYNDDDGGLSWTTNKDEATIKVSDELGSFDIKGLAEGTYYLEEIEAPDGYNLLTEPVEVVVTAEFDNDGTLIGQSPEQFDVENNTGIRLPDTGGIGSIIFYAIGGVIIIGAAVALIVRRRMKVSQQ